MKTLLATLLILVMTACGSTTTTTPTPTPTTPNTPAPTTPTTPETSSNLVGTWEGTLSFTASGTASRRFVLEENAGIYEGSVYVCESGFGTTCSTDVIIMSVSIEDTSINISYVEASDNFNGVVTISATLSGDSFTGNVTIVSDTVGIDTGTVTFSRK